MRVHLVVLDSNLLALFVQSLTQDAQVVGERSSKDLIIVLERLHRSIGVQLTDKFVLVEVINVKGDLEQLVLIEVKQSLDQLNVKVVALRVLELGELGHDSFGDRSTVTATYNSTKVSFGDLRTDRLLFVRFL